MNSQIWIYYTENQALNFHEDKNFIMDDLESYLSEKTKTLYFNDFMYLKIKLHLEIKVNLDQSYSHSLHTAPLHYVKIVQDGETYYYFIRDYEWISENAVRLVLHMDVLNTFQIGRDYDFGGETIVKRQHFDRYKSSKYNNKFERVIDIYPEGITAPFIKGSEEVIYDTDLIKENKKMSFNLIFQNQLDPASAVTSPVLVYLLPDTPIKMEVELADSLLPSSLANTRNASEFFISMNSSLKNYSDRKFAICVYDSIHPTSGSTVEPWGTGYDESGNLIEAYEPTYRSSDYSDAFFYALVEATPEHGMDVIFYNGREGQPTTYEVYELSDYCHILCLGSGESVCTSRPALDPISEILLDDEEINDLIEQMHNVQFTRTFTYNVRDLACITDVNRTDTKYIKIIKLPYSPADFVQVTGSNTDFYGIPLGWSWGTITQETTTTKGKTKEETLQALEPEDIFSPLTRKVVMDGSSTNPREKLLLNLSDSAIRSLAVQNLDPSSSNHLLMESKLLHSDYTYEKVSYDSFSYIIKYEEIKYEESDESSDLSFRYRVSTSSNCVILNDFNEWSKQYQGEDYDRVMIINRNNDVPLYSSDYLNYLMSGYNYDVKSKNLSTIQSSVSVFTNMFDPGKLANPASMVSGAVRGISNTIFSELQAENSLSKTLSEKSYSTESINGSDDLDILDDYTDGNKYKLIQYKVHTRLEKLLVKLFQLTGYACNNYGAPDLESRTSFNYAELEPDFEYFRYIDKECRDELESKWRGGVFKVHHFNNNWDDGLDLTNIETSIWNIVK